MTTAGDFSEALEYFYERAGALPLRRLQALAGGSHVLPVSTAARIVRRQALPAGRQQCIAFLTAGLFAGPCAGAMTESGARGRTPSSATALHHIKHERSKGDVKTSHSAYAIFSLCARAPVFSPAL